MFSDGYVFCHDNYRCTNRIILFSFTNLSLLRKAMLCLDASFGKIGLQGCLHHWLARSVSIFQSLVMFFLPSFLQWDTARVILSVCIVLDYT